MQIFSNTVCNSNLQSICVQGCRKTWSNTILLTTVLWFIFTCSKTLYSLSHLIESYFLPTDHLGSPGKPRYMISTCYNRNQLSSQEKRERKREIHRVLVELSLGWMTNIWCNAPWLSVPAWALFSLLLQFANSQSRHQTWSHTQGEVVAEVRATLQAPLQRLLVNDGKSVVLIKAVEQQPSPDYNSDKVKPHLLLPDFHLPSNLKILDT